MHFRIFTSFATFVLAGSAFVAAAPISNTVAARASGDSVTLDIARRDLPTLQGIIGNVSAIIDPLLTDLSMCTCVCCPLCGSFLTANLISSTATGNAAAVTGDLTKIANELQSLETQLEGFVENSATLGTTSLSDLTTLIGPLVTVSVEILSRI